jgi:hypothetical protein
MATNEELERLVAQLSDEEAVALASAVIIDLAAERDTLKARVAKLEAERDHIVEACAQVCESRSKSLHRQRHEDGLAYRISEALEASKCAAAIRCGWKQYLPEGSPPSIV